MNLLGFDYGDRRIGFAVADDTARIALPSGFLKNDAELKKNVLDLLSSRKTETVVVGFPLNLKKEFTSATKKAVVFANSVFKWSGLPVYLVDERMTTALSYAYSHMIGIGAKESRKHIDANSAKEILDSYLINQAQCCKFEKKGMDLKSTSVLLRKIEEENDGDALKVTIHGGKHIFDCVRESGKKWLVSESNPYYYSLLMDLPFPDNVVGYEFYPFYNCARGSNG